jgi:LPS-assembly lipoprotein
VIDKNATTQSNDALPASIEVKNIRLQNYQLRGILTEIRMVLSAEVSYRAIENGQPRTLTNTIQVQRSYQYDQGVVATDNPQAEQIKVWLYDNLAQRIADQYVALSLPKITKVPTATTP